MTNAIRADIYRLFHSKGFWIAQIILIAGVTISVFIKAKTELGGLRRIYDSTTAWSGSQTLMKLSNTSFFLLYLLIPLFLNVIGHDISRSVLKNQLSTGISRSQFFLTKYLVFNIVILLQLIFYYSFGWTTASLINGSGNFSVNFWQNFFSGFLLQLLFLQAEFAIGVFVLYLTRRAVWAVLALIFVPYVTGIFEVQLASWLRFAVFQDAIAFAHFIPHADIPIYIAVSSATILLLVGLALFHFQRQDL